MYAEVFLRLFSFSRNTALARHAGLAQAADGVAIVAIALVVNLLNHFGMILHTLALVMAAL